MCDDNFRWPQKLPQDVVIATYLEINITCSKSQKPKLTISIISVISINKTLFLKSGSVVVAQSVGLHDHRIQTRSIYSSRGALRTSFTPGKVRQTVPTPKNPHGNNENTRESTSSSQAENKLSSFRFVCVFQIRHFENVL